MSETVDSGVFYIGQIPMSWSCTRIGHVCEKLERICEMADPTLICSNQGNVVYREGKSMGQTSDKLSAFQGVQKGDLLIHGMDTWHGAVAVSSLNGKCSGVVHVCESSQNKRFLAYYLRAHAFYNVYKTITNGVRGNTSDLRSWAKARTLYVAFPSLQLQEKIADYLDRKCAAIDEMVSRRRQLIEKLCELKKSIIARAVTKGIRPNRPMKDSGVPWLGEVPEHWEIRRISQTLRAFSERGSEELELLSVYLEQGVIRYSESDGSQVHKPSKDLSNYQVVTPGDLVCNNQQAWRGSVGVSKYEGRISPAYIVFKIHSMLLPQYANYLFRSRAWNPAFVLSSKGVGSIQRNLYLPWFKQHRVPIPAVAEQQEIVDYLDKKCAEIDEMIARHTGIIEKLKELKVSLISNVVTGKVDVRPQPNN